MRARALLAALAIALGASPSHTAEKAAPTIGLVCDLIEEHAGRNGLPEQYFARLIWKESRFNPNAVSPVGAQGIAQFMPGTAALRGLADSFDLHQALAASANYLADLTEKYGNLGLAAAAYNSGEGRVSRWLASGGFLPLETENYVLDIMGAPADAFIGVRKAVEVQPLDDEMPFGQACRELPVSGASMVAMATVPVLPWGIQVAGNFRRDAAVRQWQRLRQQHARVLSGHEPVVSRMRNGRSRAGIYAVRIGAETRGEADRICTALRGSGGSCVVLKNR
ncbi:lytic transglycosylase domain-containing protein [Aliihoeflea sp. 40Bstr573]|uniref:lytic transglycosylase domain-containing protein n=1 Tax=Aliihoeflea sp. 40Bstr573 TaxID=2696467 RepID=UPI0020962820|nr:lytic transglycosylase domain-containing protein [Aliihoeflea sp. 40Bstr573]MCO6388197.1 transglycosylase SLT domain-containing protein [Aliihoeflea sp. 40Bstr573]